MSSKNEIPIQSPLNMSVAFGETSVNDNLLKLSEISTSVLFESNSPYFGTSKAVFTIDFSSAQILVVNSRACQLMQYNSDELCSMKLDAIIHDSYQKKWFNLKKSFSLYSSKIPFSNEKLFELITKNGDIILTSFYLKRLENTQKCLVIAEWIDRREAAIYIDLNGKILSYDEEVPFLFQYDASNLVETDIQSLFPALNLKKHLGTHGSWTCKQHITGRTKNNNAFPVQLKISFDKNSSSDVIQILIWGYPKISGLLVLNEKLVLKNCTYYFVKLLFGSSVRSIINEPIVNLIPSFCKSDRFYENGQQQNESFGNKIELHFNSSMYENCENDLDSSYNSIKSNNMTHLKSDSKCSIINSNFKPQKLNSQNKLENFSTLKALFSHNAKKKYLHNSRTFEKPIQILMMMNNEDDNGGDDSNDNDNKEDDNEYDDHYYNYKYCFTEKKKDMDFNTFSEYFVASGMKLFGCAKHFDGTYLDIKYQVKKVALSDEVYFCVWIFSEWPNFLYVNHGSNISRTSSLNSTSIDSFITKESTLSELSIKPANVSLISQSDEILTAGEYSEHYTNVVEIGKGAFGYVKMAFRNSDGLLVVTKFIKKQKVNIGSWVHHSGLNMKIPLEISFLTTLQHPNIVRVLDVFHNDCFVQLVMEKHGAGFDLFEFIDRGPKCDEKLKSYIFRQIVSAVYYLDSLGILHRDIKDENVIINEKFEIKLIDFGSAAFTPPDESFSKFYGTVEYCSPEVLQGNRYRGPELEIWALGVTLYILTFGENPFYDVEDTVKGQFSIPSPISQELLELLQNMLDVNIETRITIDKVADNYWVNQPVIIENYSFEEVVRCHYNEAHPPKYIYEINSQEYFSKPNSKSDFTQSFETSCSNKSFQSEDFNTSNNIGESISERRDTSPITESSTPLRKKNFRVCKSAVGMRKRLENFSPLNELNSSSCGLEWFEKDSSLNTSKLKYFNKSSPNLMGTPSGLEKNISNAWEDTNNRLQVRLEKCVFAEAEGNTSRIQSSENLCNFMTNKGEKFAGT